MPKAKKSSRKMRFDYNRDRKKLKKKFLKKNNPRIEHPQIRDAWDSRKSMASNLREMGLTFDPNRSVGQRKPGAAGAPVVTKPYILHQLQEEASRPEKDTKTLSSDLLEFVQHMIRQHGDDIKAMARDEKNYYQDTPKQILRKIREYRRCHPDHYQDFMRSLGDPRDRRDGLDHMDL
ncbi:nucleolar protein 16 [Salarias fasciatus]|uniref:Nucleolar protein 16 n=1 Tax=Salarias fasciatus TaxID=181472 RepID=A0A672I3H2_SALFA|nr:nucleolar protein 16 [Salarias fasciatus]